MGHVYVDVKVRGARGEVLMKNIMVDTSATLTIMPEDILESVGAHLTQPRVRLELGDKRIVEARIYAAVIEVEGREATTAIASFKDAVPVLGVLSLEALGLKVNPVTGRLEETRPRGVYYFY